jgi:hypothetical protein
MMPPTRPPTGDELLTDPSVQRAMEEAWNDSLTADPANQHEEGGWIYQDVTTGRVTTLRALAGSMSRLELGNPPPVAGSVVVGTFHTHPNPTAEGWEPGPSQTDQANALLTGVPWLIRADDGFHVTGPDSRRGGFSGGPGFPP